MPSLIVSRIAAAIGAAAQQEIARAIDDPAIPVRSDAAPVASSRIASQIEEVVRPIVAHATNQEPFYRSRVFWGATLSLATPILALAGVSIDPEQQEAIVTTVLLVPPVIGGLTALYGRFAAVRPIGT